MNTQFLHPRYWPIWIAVAILRCIILLPHPTRMFLGRALGSCFYLFSLKRRQIASINITICFPHLTASQNKTLVRKHFTSLGMSVIESAMAWWKNSQTFKNLAEIEGQEHLDAAIAQDRGVILLSAHFNSLEISLPLLTSNRGYLVQPVYQENSNIFLEKLIQTGREKNAEKMISHKNIRLMIRALKQKKIVWYAPDQGYNGKFSEIVPFFSIPSASNTAISRLAKMTGAVVVPFFIRQKQNNEGYILTISPALENFPSADSIEDTQRYHQLVEAEIQKSPEQYLWIHRRFKNRPKQYPDLYQDIVLRK